MSTVLQYSCDPGYLPVGASFLTCNPMGRWTSEPPRCIRSDGKKPTSLPRCLHFRPSGHLVSPRNPDRIDFICVSAFKSLQNRFIVTLVKQKPLDERSETHHCLESTSSLCNNRTHAALIVA